MVVAVLTLVSAAQVHVGPAGGPMKFGPELPFGPAGPPAILREYAEVLRARGREAQELAERLYREAEGLDRLAQDRFGLGKGPQGMDPGRREMMEVRGRIERLRNEAGRAKEEGRFDESQRLSNEAQDIEAKLMREQEIRRMAENLGLMKQKAAFVRQQSVQAKQDGRHEEARELWEKAEQIDRDLREGLEKIERFRMDSQVKDRQMMAERARKQAGDRKIPASPKKVSPSQERVKVAPKGPAQDGELNRAVEELKGEVKQLRRELEAMKSRAGESKPM
jgi:tetratricopeptide (TPR) repeat protein